MFTVVIRSINQFGEKEWEREVESETLHGARIKAGKHIKAHVADCDYDGISKRKVAADLEIWEI